MARGVNRIGGATGPDSASASPGDCVRAVLQALADSFYPHRIVAPWIEPGVHGHPRLQWRQGEHRLEFLSSPDEPSPFFYANSQTGWMWEAEWNPAQPIPRKVKEALRACGAVEPKFSSPAQLIQRFTQLS